MSAESEDFGEGFSAEDEDGTSELESGDLDDYGSSGSDDYDYGDGDDGDEDYLHDSYTGDVDEDDLFE
jgi:DNA-directed RNA polymerase subunit beta